MKKKNTENMWPNRNRQIDKVNERKQKTIWNNIKIIKFVSMWFIQNFSIFFLSLFTKQRKRERARGFDNTKHLKMLRLSCSGNQQTEKLLYNHYNGLWILHGGLIMNTCASNLDYFVSFASCFPLRLNEDQSAWNSTKLRDLRLFFCSWPETN